MSDLARKTGPWAVLSAVFVVAVILNYAWETAQAVLYTSIGTLARGLWRCFAASLGDAVLVIVITAIGCAAFRRLNWFANPGRAGYVVLLLSGLAIGLIVEWSGLRSGRWGYTRMPVIPGPGVGIVPIAQMVVLPPVILRIVARWQGGRRFDSGDRRQGRGRADRTTADG